MTAQTLPDDPNYCFVPAYDIEDEVQQIRIVVDGMTGYIPTALVALTIKDIAEKNPSRPWKEKKGLMAFLKSL